VKTVKSALFNKTNIKINSHMSISLRPTNPNPVPAPAAQQLVEAVEL